MDRAAAVVFPAAAAYIPAVSAIVAVNGRYRWPVEDLLIPVAAFFVSRFLSTPFRHRAEGLRERRSRQTESHLKRSDSVLTSHWMLLLISGLALVPRLYVALHRAIGYNGYWHVFAARNLSREFGGIAHPPLFLLLLNAVASLGRNQLVYRSVSLAAGLVMILAIGRVLQKLCSDPVVPVLGAFAAAFSASLIILSVEVESYTLCAVFLLWSFYYYLDFAQAEPAPNARKSRIRFAVLTSLALLSHYSAGLFVGACLLTPLAVAAIRPSYRQAFRRSLPRRRAADVLTFLPPAVVGVSVYAWLAWRWVGSLNTLPEHFFRPHLETAFEFTVRNLHNTVNLLSPVTLPGRATAILLFILFLAAVMAATHEDKLAPLGGEKRAMPAMFLLVLLAAGISLGLLRLYPFGGRMRHQYLIHLFALIPGFVALDRILRLVRSHRVQAGVLLLCAGAITASFAGSLRGLSVFEREPFFEQVRLFQREFPEARTIHLDQYNLVGFFAQHHDWDWSFAGRPPGNPRAERYELEREGRSLTLFAHRTLWNMDFRQPSLYRDLEAAHADGDRCGWIFCTRQSWYPVPGEEPMIANPARIAESMSSEGHLEPVRFSLQGEDVYGKFCLSPRAGTPGSRPRITSLFPRTTTAGVPFQTQSDGMAAISIIGRDFRSGAIVTIDGLTLPTTFGTSGLITAVVPAKLYATPSVRQIRVRNPDKATSDPFPFEISR